MPAKYLASIVVSVFTLLSTPSWLNGAEISAPVDRFIKEMVKEHAMDKATLQQLFAQAAFRQDILDKMNGRAEQKGWHQYRPIFLTEKRIAQGVEFWRQNAVLLQQAEQRFGVDAAIIVAILGVETFYGTRTGETRVLDALYTLAFGYPERAPFFRAELKNFLLLSGEANFDPLTVTGSYAGAMGASQFISSSYRNFAVDADLDGHTDLWNSKADIIASVANYFAEHGWQPGEPIALRVTGVDVPRHREWILGGAVPGPRVINPQDRPNFPISNLIQAGITLEHPIRSETRTYLLPFESSSESYEFWAVFDNFYVITRYNRSPLYAMAVYHLSQELTARYRAQ